MSNTDVNAFLKGSETLEISLLNKARSDADPATLLDTQFSIRESGKREGKNKLKAQDFNSFVSSRREIYFNNLREKSESTRLERRNAFNSFVRDYMNKHYQGRISNVFIDASKRVNASTFDFYNYFVNTNGYWGSKSQTTRSSSLYHYVNTNNLRGPNHFIELRRAGIEMAKESDHIDDSEWGWFRVLDLLQFNGRIDFFAQMAVLMENAFPSVLDYENNKESYYYFVAFKEDYPMPTPEMMDMAAKKACYYNTDKYAKDTNKFIDYMAEANSSNNSDYTFYFEPPPSRKHMLGNNPDKAGAETTYGMPDMNPNYSDKAYRENVVYWQNRGVRRDVVWTEAYANINGFVAFGHSTHAEWWWPRPRDGYAFVSKIGFILPQTFTYRGVIKLDSMYQWSQRILERQRRAAARARRRKKRSSGIGGFLETVISSSSDIAKGDIWKAGGKIVGSAISLTNPLRITQEIWSNNNILKDVWREAENFTGNFLSQAVSVSEITPRWIMGEAISEEELMMALDIGIKGVVIAASGGSATAAIGVASSQLQRGSWGKDEVGSLLLSIGEVAAIAHSADMGLEEAAEMFAVNQVANKAKSEVYKVSDLDETVFGTFVVELGVGTGKGVYNGMAFKDAAMDVADKSAIASLAKESPEMAMIASIAIEVGKHGADFFIPSKEALNSTEEYFDNFSWEKLGSDIKSLVKEIDSKDLKRIIGMSIMVAAGKIKGKDALRYIGKEIAVRQITRFYKNEPVAKTGPPKGQARLNQLRAEMEKVKREEALFQKVKSGHIPSPHELRSIVDSDTASWLYDSVSDVIPPGAQGQAWDMTFNLGLPKWSVPEFGIDIDIPEWAKIGSTEMPDWAKIPKTEVPKSLQFSLKEEQKKKIGESFEKFKKKQIDKYTWDKVLSSYLHSLWPPGTPLKKPGDTSGEYKYIGPDGKVYLRKPLNFSYEHPMILAGKIPHRLTKKEKSYTEGRAKELKDARLAYKKLTGEDLPVGGMA